MNIFKLIKKKKKIQQVENIPVSYEEELKTQLDMSSYITFDRVKEHLVDMIEENSKLKEELDRTKEEKYKDWKRLNKEKELAMITADERDKKVKDLQKENKKLQQSNEKLNNEINKLKRELTDYKVKKEMSKSLIEE
ncbi:hypothetical protein [Eubacterium sp.]|uniref:hypothetical protein n=1 Tax=Eubacterium TaxID=1730 RepID=UPI003994B0E3